jgi:hypothetical protein
MFYRFSAETVLAFAIGAPATLILVCIFLYSHYYG